MGFSSPSSSALTVTRHTEEKKKRYMGNLTVGRAEILRFENKGLEECLCTSFQLQRGC